MCLFQVLGIVHVLTGPDHLSALATLSANVSSTQSFWYGVRWGIGHSIGLVVVGSIFIFISSTNEGNGEDTVTFPGAFETFAECLVGMFMVLLGSYQLYTAFKNKSRDNLEMNDISLSIINDFSEQDRWDTEDQTASFATKQGFESNPSISSNSPGSQHSVLDTTMRVRHDGDMHCQEKDAISQMRQSSSFSISNVFQHSHFDDGFDDHNQLQPRNGDDGVSPRKQVIAICIGIIHGVAGPGGVLGVVPAVQLHDAFLSTVYLGTFCSCSTLTMGAYAACYGYISSLISGTNADISFRIEVFSAGLSIFVGTLWLFLLSIGKLEDIFP